MKRWIQIDGELLEVSDDYQPEQQAKHYVVGDRHYDGLRSPIDGADISTRAKHRRYMKENNLSTMDDWKDEWSNAEKKRNNIQKGIDPARREAIARALAQELDQRKRKKK